MLPALLLLTACTRSPLDQAMQGVWSWDSDHLAPIAAEQHLNVTYTFDRGAFVYGACCFLQNTHYWGNYYLENEDETHATIQLVNIEGAPGGADRYEIKVRYDPETDTLNLGGTGPFVRITSRGEEN